MESKSFLEGVKIIRANTEFARQMSERMLDKLEAGRSGWDGQGETAIKDYEIVVRIKEKIQKKEMTKKDWIDIANFAMMGWFAAPISKP